MTEPRDIEAASIFASPDTTRAPQSGGALLGLILIVVAALAVLLLLTERGAATSAQLPGSTPLTAARASGRGSRGEAEAGHHQFVEAR